MKKLGIFTALLLVIFMTAGVLTAVCEGLAGEEFIKIDAAKSEYELKEGFNFIAVVQSRYVLVWTADALSTQDEDALADYIRDNDRSTASRAFYFTTENPITAPFTSSTLGSYRIEGNRLLSDRRKISHLDYGRYSADDPVPDPTPTPTPDPTPTPAPLPTPSVPPKTGDGRPLGLILILMAGTLAAGIYLLVGSKKRA